MIIQFTVENFLSFKEPATLSLAASALKEKQTRSDEIVFELEGTNLSLLKSAVIYGANASGKSNLVKALDFFKWFVINSSKGVQSGESIRVESFRLNRRTEQEPVILRRSLPTKRSNTAMGSKSMKNVYTGSGFIKRATSARQRRWNCSCVTAMSMNCIPNFGRQRGCRQKNGARQCAASFRGSTVQRKRLGGNHGMLANTTIVLGSSDERIWEMAIAQIDDPSMKRRIVEFARFADFGIDDIRKVDNTVISHTSNMTRRATPRRRSLSRSA